MYYVNGKIFLEKLVVAVSYVSVTVIRAVPMFNKQKKSPKSTAKF